MASFKKTYLLNLLASWAMLLNGCIEPFDISPEIKASESALVIEATLTNELKRQQILISRSADFEIVNQVDSIYDPTNPLRPKESSFIFERNARVSVSSDQGSDYTFNETSPGTYTSATDFAAQQGVGYTLFVQTTDGSTYSSSTERFDGIAKIDALYAERETNEFGTEGIYIYVDGSINGGRANFYRYGYEETYKIVAPSWQREDFVLTNYDPCALPTITYDLEIIFRDNDEGHVCYNTDASSAIVQNSTLGLQEDQLLRVPVRFIDRSNYILSHRYSILVKQYVQTADAYAYYQNLNNFSSSTSVFSAVQPGFLEGNISANIPVDKKVLGYFEVASVTEKRLFFNYTDYFDNEPLPDYPIACVPWSPPLEHTSYCFTGMLGGLCPLSIVESVNINLLSYFDENTQNSGSCPGPYLVNYRACGDCTILGASAVPDFWIE